MSFADCVKSAVDQGEISTQEAVRLNGLYASFLARHAKDSPISAPTEAAKMLAELLKMEAGHKKRQLALAIRNLKEIEANFEKFADLTGQADVADAAIAHLEHFGTAPFSSVQGRSGAIIGTAHARMEALLHHFRRGAVFGDKNRHNKAQQSNVVSELFGTDTGDQAAKGLAQAWTETAEWLRRRFNAAGGAIKKLDNWGLPQFHDARALRKVGVDAWKKQIAPLLDPSRMRHPLTGHGITAEELDDVLTHVWHSIAQDGWNTREPTRQVFGRGALANQRQEHRFLVFNSPESWMAYQRDFGEGDPFAAMMRHVNMMAHDIAAMEVLGPNPRATVEWLKQTVTKEASKASIGDESARWRGAPKNALAKGRRKVAKIEKMWASIRGDLETPVSTGWADVLATGRNWLVSSILGSAALSAIGDAGTQVVARKFAGIPAASVAGDIARAFTQGERREAVAGSLILESAQHTFHRQARYVGTLSGPEWSSYLADRVLTWTGLTPWTQAGRHAFGLAFQHEVARRVGDGFDDLPDAFRLTFDRWGITFEDWNKIRLAKVHDARSGAPLLRPAEIAGIDPLLADRYLEMIQAETEYAVPTGSVAARTVLVSSDQPGTFWGEVTRSFAMFKSFASVIAVLNAQRMTMQIAGKSTLFSARGAAYAGGLLFSTTLLGGLSMQLKQIAGGRDPRDMTTMEFWGAALLQGGGLGIYGDFLFSDVNRYGGGFPSTLGGPLIEHIWDAWTLTGGNAIELAQGKKTKAGREFVRFLKSNIPLGTMWPTRLGYERVLLDQLQHLVDPDANRSFKARQNWWKRETGQKFFWQPGQTAPRRAPDFSQALGN